MFLPYKHSAVLGILLSLHSLLSHRFVCGQALTTVQNCSCSGTGRMCNFENRYKPEDGSLNKENVALGKPTNLSTTHLPNVKFLNREGCLAVNGDRGTTLSFLQDGPTIANCIHTGYSDNGPYWFLNLGRRYTITNIVIYHRKGYEHRSVSVTILVDGQLCYKFKSTPPTVFSFKCERTLKGEVVVASRASYTDPEYALTFCEFEVWVCIQGFYGPDCEFSCGNCTVRGCDVITGSCPTEECLDGYYGTGCFLKCGACKDSKCHFNGSCITGCQDGFKGDNCTQEIVKDEPVSAVETKDSILGYIVGAVGLCLGLLSGVLFLLMRRKMRRRQQPVISDHKMPIHTEPEPAKTLRKISEGDWESFIWMGEPKQWQNGESSSVDEEDEGDEEDWEWESESIDSFEIDRFGGRSRLPDIPEEDEEIA